MLIHWLILIGALVVLTAGAEALVRGASAAALRLGVSPLFVGLTVVGFGTSSPELAASVAATLRGQLGISVGNVVGSNIFNIAVILGVTALVSPIVIGIDAVRRDLRIMIAAVVVPFAAAFLGHEVPQWLGGLMVLGLVAFLWSAYAAGRRAGAEEKARAAAELEASLGVHAPGEGGAAPAAKPPLGERWWFCAVLVLGGLGALIGGAHYFVLSAVEIARGFGISELVIGLTIVAAGTSMPELVTSIVAAIRRSPDIAVGNIIGSNIFNILGILGVAAVIRPQTVSSQVLVLDLPVMLAACLALGPLLKSGGRISRIEGACLLAAYGVYLGVLLVFVPRWFG